MESNVNTLRILAEQAKSFLQGKGYAPSSIKHYATCWDSLIRYTDLRMIGEFSNELCENFLQAGGKKFQNLGGAADKDDIRGIKLLTSFVEDQIVAAHMQRTPVAPQPYLETAKAYIAFMQSIGQTAASIKSKRSRIKIFLDSILGIGIHALNDVSREGIVSFMDHLTSKYTSVARANILYSVKDFLKFCEREGYITTKLSHLIKGIYANPNEKLPSTYTQEEIALLLESVNRETSSGKKHYAILVLVAQLGIRASDIISITLDDIKWEQGIIEFSQYKTGTYVRLPLIDSVKYALADYLKNSRPATEYKQLFIRDRAPVAPYKVSGSIFAIVSKQFQIAGVSSDGKCRGPHSLRHSLASGLLKEEIPLPVIASVLGHINTKNTNRYLRIDIGQLRKVALEVPV